MKHCLAPTTLMLLSSFLRALLFFTNASALFCVLEICLLFLRFIRELFLPFSVLLAVLQLLNLRVNVAIKTRLSHIFRTHCLTSRN